MFRTLGWRRGCAVQGGCRGGGGGGASFAGGKYCIYIYCIYLCMCTVQILAAQLYEAAKDEGCVDPDKVETILGISEQQAAAYVDTDDTATDTLGKICYICCCLFPFSY